MKKTGTIVFTLFMVLAMFLGLTACGEKITLANQTVNDLSFDVPSDFIAFADKNGVMMSKNEKSTASITLSAAVDSQGTVATDWTEESYTNMITTLSDVTYVDFDANATAAGVPAVYIHYTAKNSSGVAVEAYNYILYPDDGLYQTISFTFTKDADSSLKTNIEAIKNSLAYK